MKTGIKMLHSGVTPIEYPRISHTVCLADFNTSHPCLNRINRIASEINEYLSYKNKDKVEK